jgi:adenylosuccinate lyase
LFELIANDPIFKMTLDEIKAVCAPKKLSGRSAHQVTDYLEEEVYPILEENKNLLTDINTEVTV